MKDKVEPQISSWEDAVLWLKAQPNQQDLIQACFYDDPLHVAVDRYHQSSEWQALTAYLPAPGKVLDIGSGRGISAYAFAKDGWDVHALEPDESDIVGAGAIKQLVESAHLSIKVEQTWGEKLPYADASFDLVHGRQVLHHAHDLKQLCKEAARVLKPEGLFIFTREHVISKSEDLGVFLEAHPLHKLYGGEHAYKLNEYTQAIESAGIVLQSVLNPLESDINLYPDNVANCKKNIAKKLKFPSCMIPKLALSIYGNRIKAPGRLYSFVGYKSV